MGIGTQRSSTIPEPVPTYCFVFREGAISGGEGCGRNPHLRLGIRYLGTCATLPTYRYLTYHPSEPVEEEKREADYRRETKRELRS